MTLAEDEILMGEFSQQERGSIEYKLVSDVVRVSAFKTPSTVIQPDDDVIRMKQIGPNQIVVAVIVYVVGEQRAAFFGSGVEEQDGWRLGLAEAYVDAFATAGRAKRGTVNAVVAVEVSKGKVLSEPQEGVCVRDFA